MSKARKMTIFRKGENKDPQHEMMSIEGLETLTEPQRDLLSKTSDKIGGIICLFRSPEPNGPCLTHAWAKSGFTLPKHSHNTDCLYYILGGEMHLGGAVLKPGDGVFMPKDQSYTFTAGPNGMEMLEFRSDSIFNMEIKGNDEAFWERFVNVAREREKFWETEQRPSKLTAVD